ncbi:hypothetical protein A0H81_13620 [Grifola frondosa]|uniref:Uncharacterized protein n=1 Tax=Grifola frondosa TaxID=5627 RepID=A0A1C7LQB1_GRIFR|nr:hypothetical protein A0H81_13620 [Grifola frondosa]
MPLPNRCTLDIDGAHRKKLTSFLPLSLAQPYTELQPSSRSSTEHLSGPIRVRRQRYQACCSIGRRNLHDGIAGRDCMSKQRYNLV